MRWIDRKLSLLTAAATPPLTPVIYGVKIQKNNPDPFASVTYTDDAAGLAPSQGGNGVFADKGWSGRFPFDRIRPCLLKNGVVQYFLDPEDFTKTRAGTPSVLTGADGDVMVEFPKIWYSITQDSDSLYVRCANHPAAGFTDAAFSYKGMVREKFYLGAYLASLSGGNLRSVSGVLPATQLTTASLRSAAQLGGTGYECLPFNKLILLHVLYLIRFKSLNGQAALGMGYTAGSGTVPVGSLNRAGMNWGGEASSSVKFCGLEDFWGHCNQFIDGILANADGSGGVKAGNIAGADGNFNATGTGYKLLKTGTPTVSGFMRAPHGTDALGFLLTSTGGSTSTYFCDNAYFTSTASLRAMQFGGYYDFEEDAGPFCHQFSLTVTSAPAFTSTRLCWCG